MEYCPIHNILLRKYRDMLICPDNECFYRYTEQQQKQPELVQENGAPPIMEKQKKRIFWETSYRKKVLRFQRKPLKEKQLVWIAAGEQRGVLDYGKDKSV